MNERRIVYRSELMAATGWTVQYFRLLVRKRNLPSPDFAPFRGRNGREPGWYYESLPEGIREKVQGSMSNAEETAREISPETGPHAQAEKHLAAPQARPETSALAPAVPLIGILPPAAPERFSRVGNLRADLIRHLRADMDRNGRSKTEIIGQFLEAYNAGILLPQIFRELGKISRSTLYEWLKKENEGGIRALAPAYGRGGSSKITEEEKNTLMGLLLNQNRIKVYSAIRLMKYVLKTRDIESPSSPVTLRRFVDKFKKEHYDIWTLFREGEKALNDKVLPYIERDRELLQVGDGFVADGHKLNFDVINPFTGKRCRAALILFQDWRSSYPLGWEIMLEENVQCISSALRMAILTLGRVPKWILLDNGKAFKAKVFTSDINLDEAGLYGMYARLGIQTHFAMPYNAQAKPIERFFRTFTDWFERLQPSFVGACINDKPAYMRRNEKLLRSLNSGFVPTIPEAMEMMLKWREFYVDEPSRGLNGKTPREIFEAGRAAQGEGGEEQKILPADLHYLMMAMEPRKLHRNGVSFLGCNWYSDALYGLKDEVVIRYSFSDLSQIYIFTRNNEFLCAARPVGKIHPMISEADNPKDLETFKRAQARKHSLKKETVRVTRLLGPEAEKSLPWTQIVAEAPDVIGAIERAEREKNPPMLNPSPFLDSATENTESAEQIKIKESSRGRPWFFNDYEKYDWVIKQERLTSDDRKFIDDFRATSTLYKHEKFEDAAELDAKVITNA